MASIRKERDKKTGNFNGCKTVLFVCPRSKKRKGVRLGKTDLPTANSIKSKIELIISAVSGNTSIASEATQWLTRISDTLHDRIARTGLIEARHSNNVHTLGELVEKCVEAAQHKKPATVIKIKQAGENLKRYFKANKSIEHISPGDAELWRIWLKDHGNIREGKKRKVKGRLSKAVKQQPRRTSLSENTVRRRSGLAKQIFSFAVKMRWIAENPFKELVCSVTANEERMQYVPAEVISKAIEAAPNAEWRAIIALARFGGLRIPSELAKMTWNDIDFVAGRMTIRASKTEHHRGKGIRFCPIFPKLRPYLEELAEIAEPGNKTSFSDRVFPNGGDSANLRTGFLRILERAGVTAWPKLFQNLRASCETDLLEHYPVKDVCSAIGNTQAIAMKHYAMAKDEIFDRMKSEDIFVDQKSVTVEPETTQKGLSIRQTFVGKRHKKTKESLKKSRLYLENVLKRNGRYWTRTNDLNDVNVAL